MIKLPDSSKVTFHSAAELALASPESGPDALEAEISRSSAILRPNSI